LNSVMDRLKLLVYSNEPGSNKYWPYIDAIKLLKSTTCFANITWPNIAKPINIQKKKLLKTTTIM
jgi:hypothetical protein